MVEQFKRGDRVFWTDPEDGLSSGAATVVEGADDVPLAEDSIVYIALDDGSEAEVYPAELARLQ